MKNKYDKLIDDAIRYNENGCFLKAIQILEDFKKKSIDDNQLTLKLINAHIAYNFYELGKYHEALEYFNMTIDEDDSFEFGSIGKYLTLLGLDLHEDAINELFRFLAHNNADLYKTTLKELLEGLTMGYMSIYEDNIKKIALRNEVSLTV